MVACRGVHGRQRPHLVFAATAWLVSMLALPGDAHADGLLVLIEPDPALQHAAEVALAPWGLHVQARAGGSPGGSLPRSAERAHDLARRHDATALAWISQNEGGHALWVYERGEDRVVAQPIRTGPPYDDAQAAALALTLKALLRHSLAAPDSERFGAVVQPSPREGWLLGVAGGLRAFELQGGSLEPRLWLSTAYLWPALGGVLGPLLEANLGLGGVDVTDPEADVRLYAHSLGLGASARWPLGARFDLAATGTLTLRLSSLQGALTMPESAVDVRRANPTLAARLEGGVWTGPIRLSLRAGFDAPLRSQTFTVDGRQVLSLAAAAFETAFAVELRL